MRVPLICTRTAINIAGMARLLVWILLAAPLALLTYNYVFETAWLLGEVYYGGYVHDTGRYAAWLLLAILLITPLRLAFPGNGAIRWLAAQRRYLGVASFAYAAAHLIAFIFAALALTSNDWAVRRMRRGWKSLHRLAHPAAILVFAHWVLTAFDPFLAWCHVAALALIEGWRIAMTRRPRPATS